MRKWGLVAFILIAIKERRIAIHIYFMKAMAADPRLLWPIPSVPVRDRFNYDETGADGVH